MDEWSPRLKLVTVLSTTYVLLQNSTEEGWPDEKPAEAAHMVERMIAHLFDPARPLPEFWQVLFAPTGPAQEIAMNNGWHDAYMKLSSEFDRLDYLLKQSDGASSK